MSENVHPLFPHSEGSNSDRSAPPLPVEQHAVSAALAAERLRGLAEQMLLLLRHVPRDAATFTRLHGEMLDAWGGAGSHYSDYRAILECKGQA